MIRNPKCLFNAFTAAHMSATYYNIIFHFFTIIWSSSLYIEYTRNYYRKEMLSERPRFGTCICPQPQQESTMVSLYMEYIILYIIYNTIYIIYNILHVTLRVSCYMLQHVTCYNMLHVTTCYMLHVTCYMLHVTCYMLYIIYYVFHFKNSLIIHEDKTKEIHV